MTPRSNLCLYLLNLFGSSYPDVWENRATTASRHVLADGGIGRRRRADTVPFGSVSVPPERSYISKIFILRGDSGMLSRGGQGVCPVLDRALGRCSGLRCNWWKKMNGQGHSWLKVLHLDWNIPFLSQHTHTHTYRYNHTHLSQDTTSDQRP